MRTFTYMLALIFTGLTISYTHAQVPSLSFQSLQTGLSSPLDIANAGDGSSRLFIVEKGGTIRIWKSGALLTTPFLNVSSVILNNASERGLLSVAFHPDYENNRYFFIYYTNLSGDITVARYRADASNPDIADPSSGVVLLNIPKPASNHNGGKLNFGPDGYLYFGTGDGGGAGDVPNNAQNGNSLLGKMLRLNVNDFLTPPYYSIPADNPYVSDPAVRDEIWALGLRNPWRWSFDRLNNDIWIADVGQGAWEEVNTRSLATSGGINYGWRCYEGNAGYNTSGCAAASAYISPIFVYPHNNTTGGFSITGGYVYRGTEFPGLQGYYICADYVSGNGWLIKANGSGGWDATQQGGWPGNIASFGEAEDGSWHAVTLNGSFYKINAVVPIPVTLRGFRALATEAGVELRWQTEQQINAHHFEVEFGTDGQRFSTVGTVMVRDGNGTLHYSYLHQQAPNSGSLYYRLKIVDVDGRYAYSDIIRQETRGDKLGRVWPSVISDGVLRVYPGVGAQGLIVYDTHGKQVMQKGINGLSTVSVDVAGLAKGIYIVSLYSKDERHNEKIVIQ